MQRTIALTDLDEVAAAAVLGTKPIEVDRKWIGERGVGVQRRRHGLAGGGCAPRERTGEEDQGDCRRSASHAGCPRGLASQTWPAQAAYRSRNDDYFRP